jgi:lipoprotein-releasing system permease protein
MKTPVLFLIKRPLISTGKHSFRMEYWIMLWSIIISVTVVSTAINLFEGYQQSLKKILLNSSAHIFIYSNSESNLTAEKVQFVQTKLKSEAAIKTIKPVVANTAMLRIGNKVRGCMVRAYPTLLEKGAADNWYRDYITTGNSDLKQGSVIIGDRLAQDLALKLGDNVTLLYPQTKNATPFGLMPLQRNFTLSGIVRTGYYEMDRALILMQANDAFDFYNIPPEYTYMEINLQNISVDKAEALASRYAGIVGSNFQLRTWVDFNGNLFALIAMEKWLIFLVFGFLILIAALNSISTVSTTILERKKEIALLKTLGMAIGQIKQVIYYRILLICVISIITGLMLGAMAAWLITKQSFYQLKGEVYFIDKITMHISALNYLAVFILALITVGLCIRFPLKYVNKLQIVDILRGN